MFTMRLLSLPGRSLVIVMFFLHNVSIFLNVGTDTAAAVAHEINEVVALNIELISNGHPVIGCSEVGAPI